MKRGGNPAFAGGNSSACTVCFDRRKLRTAACPGETVENSLLLPAISYLRGVETLIKSHQMRGTGVHVAGAAGRENYCAADERGWTSSRSTVPHFRPHWSIRSFLPSRNDRWRFDIFSSRKTISAWWLRIKLDRIFIFIFILFLYFYVFVISIFQKPMIISLSVSPFFHLSE